MVRKPVLVFATVATLAYPFAVYFGFGRVPPAWLAGGLVLLALARAWLLRDPIWLAAGGGAAVLALASLWGDSWVPVKLYPVLVSLMLLAVFTGSLLRPPNVIERLARLSDPLLPPQAVAYTRKVALAWCLFFACNGSIALATAWLGSDKAWLFYNGFLAYVLMGALFAGEWVLRRRLRARLGAIPAGVPTHG